MCVTANLRAIVAIKIWTVNNFYRLAERVIWNNSVEADGQEPSRRALNLSLERETQHIYPTGKKEKGAIGSHSSQDEWSVNSSSNVPREKSGNAYFFAFAAGFLAAVPAAFFGAALGAAFFGAAALDAAALGAAAFFGAAFFGAAALGAAAFFGAAFFGAAALGAAAFFGAAFFGAAALGAAAFFGAAFFGAAALGAAAFFGAAAFGAAALGAAAFFGAAAFGAAALGAAAFFGAAFLAAEAAGLAATVFVVAAFFGAAAAFEPVTFGLGMGFVSLKVKCTALTVLIIHFFRFCQMCRHHYCQIPPTSFYPDTPGERKPGQECRLWCSARRLALTMRHQGNSMEFWREP